MCRGIREFPSCNFVPDPTLDVKVQSLLRNLRSCFLLEVQILLPVRLHQYALDRDTSSIQKRFILAQPAYERPIMPSAERSNQVVAFVADQFVFHFLDAPSAHLPQYSQLGCSRSVTNQAETFSNTVLVEVLQIAQGDPVARPWLVFSSLHPLLRSQCWERLQAELQIPR